MMKAVLRIMLMPVTFSARLLLGVTAFVTSIASSIIGLTVLLFALLAVIEFAIGYWQNGVAFLVLAWLASPLGLPLMVNILLFVLDHVIGLVERII